MGNYLWLTSDREALPLIRAVPGIAVGQAIALTTIDSGTVRLDEAELQAGWTSQGGIAYHSRLPDLDLLPHLPNGRYEEGFQELYTFLYSVNLGEVHTGNVFEDGTRPQSLTRFVNLYGFSPQDSEMDSLTNYSGVSWTGSSLNRTWPTALIT